VVGPNACSELLRCPGCQGRLEGGRCVGCGAAFASRFGILDLRWPRLSRAEVEAEEASFAEILEGCEACSFEELSARVRRHHFKDLSESLTEKLKDRAASMDDLGQRMVDMFDDKVSEHYGRPEGRAALDVGCGYGTATVVLARRFECVIGFDPYFPVLLLARKFLEGHGVGNVVLVQAYAQKIPLKDAAVDYAVAQNVIEHLLEVEPALHEVSRVLRPGGRFCGDSRNRFDLFFPEPHVKLRWVGLFPRGLQPWYVRRCRGVSYADWHARLLSWWELRRSARRGFGHSTRIVLPLASAYGQPPGLDRWIRRIDGVPVLRDLVLLVYPSHLLLGQKS
jgi:ubiquinone/menaquinone biosynthesis C-methylase UbiE